MCEKCEIAQIELRKLKAVAKHFGHIPRYKGAGTMIDQYVCSCGRDGLEYTLDEWIKHAKEIIESAQLS